MACNATMLFDGVLCKVEMSGEISSLESQQGRPEMDHLPHVVFLILFQLVCAVAMMTATHLGDFMTHRFQTLNPSSLPEGKKVSLLNRLLWTYDGLYSTAIALR